MRALITGITGYIGSHLARRLLPGCEVYGLIRTPVRTEYIRDIQKELTLLPYDGSLRSMTAALDASRPDIVYHLAAYYSGGHGDEITPPLLSSNIVLGGHLLEAMASVGCGSLVCASTVMAHYHGDMYRPLNLYAATKQAFSSLLLYYTDAEPLDAVTLVLSDTYGPGDHRPKILNLIRRAVAAGQTIDLSDGNQDYDVVFIDDVVNAFVLAGQYLRNGNKSSTFQVCAEDPLTLRETVDRLLMVNHIKWEGGWGKRPAGTREMRKAVRLFPTVPGWKQLICLDEGLRRFWTDDGTRVSLP